MTTDADRQVVHLDEVVVQRADATLPVQQTLSTCDSASVANAVVMAIPVTTTLGKPLPVAQSAAITALSSPSPPRRSVATEGERDIVPTESE